MSLLPSDVPQQFEEQLVIIRSEELSPTGRAGHFLKVSSAIEALSKAYQVNYTLRMTNLLWRHFEKRQKGSATNLLFKDGVSTHTTLGLCIHTELARPFCLWFSERCKEKKASLSSAGGGKKTTVDGQEILEEDFDEENSIPPSSRHTVSALSKEELSQVRAAKELRKSIANLEKRAKAFLCCADSESLPVEEVTADLTSVMMKYESVVVAQVHDDILSFLRKYCPEAKSKINWRYLLLSQRSPNSIPPDIDLMLLQPVPTNLLLDPIGLSK